jgi:predicted TIM-barrel fold metal-dependent hydrolase
MTLTLILTAVLLLAFCAALSFGGKDQGMVLAANLRVVEKPKFYPVVDAHVHIDANAAMYALAVKAMDAAGIAVVMNLSGGHGKTLAKNLKLASKYRGRFLTFCGGWPGEFNWRRRDIGEVLAKMLRESHKMGAHGFGETVKWALMKKINWDDPRLDPMWATLEELQMPINWHVADPTRYWMKETPRVMLESPDYRKGFPSKHDLIMQQERILQQYPRLVVIAAHSNWLNDQIPFLWHRLDTYPNYHIDICAACDEFGRNPDEFVDLCTRYSGRIFFGTDAGFSRRMLKNFHYSVADFKAFYVAHFLFLGTRQRMIPCAFKGNAGGIFVGYENGFVRYANDGVALPDAVLRDIYYRNTERMFGIKVPLRKPLPKFSYEM